MNYDYVYKALYCRGKVIPFGVPPLRSAKKLIFGLPAYAMSFNASFISLMSFITTDLEINKTIQCKLLSSKACTFQLIFWVNTRTDSYRIEAKSRVQIAWKESILERFCKVQTQEAGGAPKLGTPRDLQWKPVLIITLFIQDMKSSGFSMTNLVVDFSVANKN